MVVHKRFTILVSLTVALVTFLGLSSGLSLSPSHFPPNPQYPSSLGSFGTATLDGVKSTGEYGSCIGPVVPPYNLSGTFYTIVFCETNDGSNDYYYFEINDTTQDGNDRFYLLFDNLHDGVIPTTCGPGLPVEDALGFLLPPPRPLGPILDFHYCGLPFTDEPPASVDGAQHIAGVGSFTPGQGYRFEISHPLNSGDSEDYGLAIPSTVGWCIWYRDASKPAPNIVEYPPDCFSVYRQNGNANFYGHVNKVPGETTTSQTTHTTTVTSTTTITRTVTVTNTTTVTTTVTNTTVSTVTTTVTVPTTVTTTTTQTVPTTTTVTTTTTTTATTTVTTTRTLETTTTVTTTSVVIDPILEMKLYVVIALLLVIIWLLWWLYKKCCKKKWFPPPSQATSPPPPQPPTPAEGIINTIKTQTFREQQPPQPPTQIAVGEEGHPAEEGKPRKPKKVNSISS